MARIKKKGTSGAATSYITRTQAIRKLQISLPDFRRLCIFKGIYPREPRNKKKASKTATPATTFYYTRDIQYLLHEPLLQKFRAHKALAKKIGRALGRNEASDAARLERTQKPRITLDHIIKERYPTFVDALRDLDDALSMLFLFANLPSTSTIPPKTIALCQRLCHEFQHYLIITHSLRKSFLSIKGIYYQATIQGQDILWLVPYKFVQRTSGDIDFRIMGTFIEFYTTLLGFVNFRLYTSIGLIYPPKFDALSDEKGAELGAFTLQQRSIEYANDVPKQIESSGKHEATNGVDAAAAAATEKAQAAADILRSSDPYDASGNFVKDTEPDLEDEPEKDLSEIDTFPTSASKDADILPQPGVSSNDAATLFSDFAFYLSRETPRQPLEFLLKAFGCKRVGWDAVLGDGAFTTNELDPSITHQIVDKPLVAPVSNNEQTNGDSSSVEKVQSRGRVPGRTYVQPQWVWDCVNECKLLRPDLYAPGAMLPPHLSPWVKPTKGEYDPTAPLEPLDDPVATITAQPDEIKNEEEDDSEEEVNDLEGEDEDDAEEISNASSDENDDISPSKLRNSQEADWSGLSSDEEDEDATTASKNTKQTQRELELEAANKPVSTGSTSLKSALKKPTPAQREERARQEQLERQKMMMSRRKRKLFEKMQYSNAKKEEETARLVAKRRKIENGL